MKFLIFSQFWPRLDQAVQIGPIFARMAHQASEGWIFARTMASGLKILIFSPACSGSCGGLPSLSDAFSTALWGLDVSLRMTYAISAAPWSTSVVRTCTTTCVSLFRAGCTKPNLSIANNLSPCPQGHCSRQSAGCTTSHSSLPGSLGCPTRPRSSIYSQMPTVFIPLATRSTRMGTPPDWCSLISSQTHRDVATTMQPLPSVVVK